MSEKLIEMLGCERITADFINPIFKPQSAITTKNIRFNTACVRLFPDTEYIRLVVNEDKKQLYVFPSDKTAADAIKWSNINGEKSQPRTIHAASFCIKIFQMMDWKTRYSYKVTAHYFQKRILLNLSDYEMSALKSQDKPRGNNMAGDIIDNEFVGVLSESAKILRDRRKLKKLTQQEVADIADINIRQYQMFECGTRELKNAPFRLAMNVCNTLDIKPNELF